MAEVASAASNADCVPEALAAGSTDLSEKDCHLSAKVKEKLENLAGWRVKLSDVTLTEGISIKGGFATVCQGTVVFDPPTGEIESIPETYISAVKMLNIQSVDDRNRVLGLALREAAFLASLDHPYIISLLGFVENISEDRIWLLFPWAEHGNLRAFIASADWEVPERISLIWDVVQGVEYLHDQDPPICHGDLKSVNIVVNAEYHAVITDFGSARRVVENDGRRSRSTSSAGHRPEEDSDATLETTISAATNTITITGNQFTLRWAAPELLTDDYGDEKSDIWAMGWVLYEIMTGTIPFENIKKDTAVTRHILQGKLPSITEHARIALTLALGSLMSGCWKTTPHQRPTAEACRKFVAWLPMSTPTLKRDAGPSASKAELLASVGRMYSSQNDYSNAMVTLTEALDMYNELAIKIDDANPISAREELGRAEVLRQIATVHRLQHRFEETIPLYSEAISIYTKLGETKSRAWVMIGMAESHRGQNTDSEAISLYLEAAQLMKDLDEPGGIAVTLLGRAAIHRTRKEYAEANLLCSEAAGLAEEAGDQSSKAFALESLADLHWAQREYNEAISLYIEAARVYGDFGAKESKSRCLNAIAQLQVHIDHTNGTSQIKEQDYEYFQGAKVTSEAQDDIGITEGLQHLQLSTSPADNDLHSES